MNSYTSSAEPTADAVAATSKIHLIGDDFSMLDKAGQQDRAQALGAQVISLKHLHDPVAQKIDAADASFWAARHNTDKSGPGLGQMERQRLKTWLAHANAELDRLSVSTICAICADSAPRET